MKLHLLQKSFITSLFILFCGSLALSQPIAKNFCSLCRLTSSLSFNSIGVFDTFASRGNHGLLVLSALKVGFPHLDRPITIEAHPFTHELCEDPIIASAKAALENLHLKIEKHGLQIVNISFSYRPEALPLLTYFIEAHPKVIFVMSAGNSGLCFDTPTKETEESSEYQQYIALSEKENVVFVAGTKGVIGDAFTCYQTELHPDSNRGKRILFAAPGYLMTPAGLVWGTSFAAPQIAGLLATPIIKTAHAL